MNAAVIFSLVIFSLIIPQIVEGTCHIIPITEWGGTSSNHVHALRLPISLVVVAHTDTADCNGNVACRNMVNTIRAAHKVQGMNDIGWSFVIGGNGNIYEGAGWRVGNHTQRFDDRSISIALVGEFSTSAPRTAAVTAARQLLQCFERNQLLNPIYSLVGQRQLMNTNSPGNALQNLIQTWPRWSQYIQTRPH